MSPEHSRLMMDCVASGVTSRGANPVPPVVRMRSQVDVQLFSVLEISSISSGTTPRLVTSILINPSPCFELICSAFNLSVFSRAGPDKSPEIYAPENARSLTVSTPTVKDMPPCGGGGICALILTVDPGIAQETSAADERLSTSSQQTSDRSAAACLPGAVVGVIAVSASFEDCSGAVGFSARVERRDLSCVACKGLLRL
mmetsp:Transcript_12762/g.18635  ORF Transcript_12762/g.18635 Transcript_12762/m.18635 type:complete len:200 (+) Transcript_12762:312-911(+)